MFHSPVYLFQKSFPTGLFERADKTSGLTKSIDEGVIMHLTSAPFFFSNRIRNGILYAAIPPLIPTIIRMLDFRFGIPHVNFIF